MISLAEMFESYNKLQNRSFQCGRSNCKIIFLVIFPSGLQSQPMVFFQSKCSQSQNIYKTL